MLHTPQKANLKNALQALETYYLNPTDEAAIAKLLSNPIGGARDIGAYSSRDEQGNLLATFNVEHKGLLFAFRLSVEAYAFLLTTTVLGNNIQVNRRAKDVGSPHLKFSMKPQPMTVARILSGQLDGEDALFVNGNTCDLSPGNLTTGRNHPRTFRGPVEAYIAFLMPPKSADCPNPFDGSPKDQFEARKKLMHDALNLLHSVYSYA